MTNSKGLDDGPEYSPDGKYIYFNSVRGGGTMQIWRMKADGTEPEQVTKDDLNNWFPHLSPDGKWMLLSLPERGHPAHPITARLSVMPVAGGRTGIAYGIWRTGDHNLPSGRRTAGCSRS